MSPPTPAPGARVSACHLSRSFGGLAALSDVSLEIESGECFALLGANGAGKTTFIRLVIGALLPSAGSVRVDGLSPIDDADRVHARIGYAPENARLYPELRVVDCLRVAGGLRGLASGPLRARVEASLARFQLESVAKRPVGNLSKGFQQRVSLAAALIHEPSLVIVDEPTSGLDPLQRAEVQSVLSRMRGQRTLILCTHDLGEARALSHRAGVLSEGRLNQLGPTKELLADGDSSALFGSREPRAGQGAQP